MSTLHGTASRAGLIVAIDGPSGAGKSTIARLLAERLGYLYLDTGAMYRTVALLLQRAAVPLEDDEAVAALCRGVEITFARSDEGCRVLANGEDVSEAIRTPEISLLTSRVSARKVVRDIMVRLQRRVGAAGGVVLEGRDIGTVVFPDADVKFFLSASAEERGRRRFLELAARGEDTTLEETIEAVKIRDSQDEQREHAPLRRAWDALALDTTPLTIAEVLAAMEEIVRGKMGGTVEDNPR